ncbi:hypothetical protein J3F83DRAFT_718126 [Trichoderma novae-zelandiae]
MSDRDVDAGSTKNDALSPSPNGSSVVKKRKKDPKPIVSMEDPDTAWYPQVSIVQERRLVRLLPLTASCPRYDMAGSTILVVPSPASAQVEPRKTQKLQERNQGRWA